MLKNNRKKISLLKIAVLALVAVLMLPACGKEEEEQVLLKEELMSPQAVNYKTAQVSMEDFFSTKSGKLQVVFPQSVELFWEDNNATYGKVMVSKGQEVEKGDVLITFNVDGDEVGLETLKLNLLRTREDLNNGVADRQSAIDKAYENLEDMEGALDYLIQIAELKIEKMHVDLEQFVYQTQREITKLEEEIQVLEEELAHNTLVAPFDGVIDDVKKINEGDKVEVGKTLITMYQGGTFALKAVDGVDKIRYNMPVTIGAGKENEISMSGRVVAANNILPRGVDQNLVLIQLDQEVDINDPNVRRVANQIRYTCQPEALEDILVVDRRAVQKANGKNFVYVLDGETIRKRYVMAGIDNADMMWVLDGLDEGQTVIID